MPPSSSSKPNLDYHRNRPDGPNSLETTTTRSSTSQARKTRWQMPYHEELTCKPMPYRLGNPKLKSRSQTKGKTQTSVTSSTPSKANQSKPQWLPHFSPISQLDLKNSLSMTKPDYAFPED